MKKMYIKPAAVNVAFSVNENIAISLGSRVYGDFTVQMTEATQGKCQQYLSGNHDLYLGLEDDAAADFYQLMTMVPSLPWGTLGAILGNSDHPDHQKYVNCVVGKGE